jgi:hypothetical protein
MKKLCVFLVMMIIFASVVQVQDRQLLKVTVPFSFTANNSVLPAGVYTLSLLNTSNFLCLQNLDGRHVAILLWLPSQKSDLPKVSALIFDRIDGQLFLKSIQEQDTSVERDVLLGRQAHELMAKGHDQHRHSGSVMISAR